MLIDTHLSLLVRIFTGIIVFDIYIKTMFYNIQKSCNFLKINLLFFLYFKKSTYL